MKSLDSVGTPARSPRRGQYPGNTVMKCGLRSQAAGVKSRPSGDMEVIIKKSSLAPQYVLPGRDKLGWEGLPRNSATGYGEVDVASIAGC